jgi:hypothetical protein
MAITRGIKAKIENYGLNVPTDKRTRRYQQILKENNWTETQYESYLKQLVKKYDTKTKKMSQQVQQQNYRQQVEINVRERNKVRYTGSIVVRLLITEDKEFDDNKGNDFIRGDTRNKTSNAGVFIEMFSLGFDDKINDEKEIQPSVNKKVNDLVYRVSLRPYVIDVEILNVSPSIHRHTDVPLPDIRMRQSGVYNIDGYDTQEWDTNTNRCVYDYIIHRYGNVKGFKKSCNYETLEKIFDNGNSLVEGVNTWGIRNFCRHFNICMHSLDDEEHRFMHYVPMKRNQNAPAMIYRMSNGHFYPVPEKKIKSILTINQIIDADCDAVYNIKTEEKKEKLPVENIVVLEDTNPMLEISKSIIDNDKYPDRKIVVKDGVIQSYQLNDITYCINQNIPMTKELCKNMNITYTGQSLSTILQLIIEETIKVLPKSTHNPFVFDTLLLAKENRVHYGLIEKSYEKLLNHKNTVARDISKCYTSIMYNPLSKWIRYDFNDCWEVYDGKLKLGLYYVETDDSTLFTKSHIYSNTIIEKAMKCNIEFEIKYQLIPRYQEKRDMFKLVIEKILDYSKGDKNIYKLLINMLSGMCAKTKRTSGNYKINKDINQIFQFLHKYPDLNPVIQLIPETDYYLYGAEKEMKITENNLAMYIQIIDQSNIKLYDMVKEMKGTLIGRKVDCAVVHYDNIDDKPKMLNSKKWGFNSECHIPVLKNKQEFKPKYYKFEVDNWKDYNIGDSDDWEKIKDILVEKGGLLLQADAGKGKTYVAKKIASVLKKVKKIAPTNKASLNLKGSTIHKFLNMDIEGNISTKQLNKIKRNYDYIIVDEISMITKELWRRLVFLKQATGVKFLLLGDDKQLPPVEDDKIEDYFNHPAVKYLCNNNRNILQVMKRFNLKLKKHLDNVDSIDISQFPFKDTPINIAYTNKTRKAVNKKWNDKLKTGDALFIPVREGDDKGQDMYIYNGLPLIARENDNKNGLYMNNETFIVHHYDDKKIYVDSERVNDDGEIYTNAMEVEIDKVQKLFYLNYCTTIHKVQGSTITEQFTIWDWEHPCMSRKAKYTALSRATCPEHISIVGKYEEDDYNDKKIREKLQSYLLSDKEKGLDNDLTVEKVKKLIEKQNGACNICSCDLKLHYLSNDDKQFSVDRIDSRLGHLCSNVQVLCWGCNRAKQNRF